MRVKLAKMADIIVVDNREMTGVLKTLQVVFLKKFLMFVIFKQRLSILSIIR